MDEVRLPDWVEPGVVLGHCSSCGGIAIWRELGPRRWLGACMEDGPAPGLDRPCFWGDVLPEGPKPAEG